MLNTIELSGLTTSNIVECVVGALSDALGWTVDNDGARLWCDDTKSLGIKVSTNSSSVMLTLTNSAHTTSSAISTQIGASFTTCIDYGKSKNGTATIIGAHTNNAAKLTDGTIVIAETDNGKCGLMSASSNIYEISAGTLPAKSISALKTESSMNTSEYTSLYRLPSYFGGLYKEVYGVYSCPAPAGGIRCAAAEKTFQMSQYAGNRFAVEVG